MTVKEVFDILVKLDMKAESIEGKPVGNCDLKVNRNSLCVGGIMLYPKRK